MDHPFRSAAVGGFNRQDVLAYLEERAKLAAQAEQKLQDQLDEVNHQAEALRRERDGLRCELEETRRELEAARQRRDSLSAQLEQRGRELSACQERAEGAERELEKARGERDEAWGRLASVTPDAQAYVQLKERTAGVELEAHRRAQAVQEKAEYDAQRLRRQVNQWLQRLEQEYEGLRGQVEATVSHAASQLEQAGGYLGQVVSLMGEQEAALEGLARAYNEADPTRVEAPLPLPEE